MITCTAPVVLRRDITIFYFPRKSEENRTSMYVGEKEVRKRGYRMKVVLRPYQHPQKGALPKSSP